MDIEVKLKELSDKTENLKAYLKNNHEERLKEYQIQGRNDGMMNLPAIDDSRPCETEYEIRNKYKSDINYLEEIGLPLLDEPHNDYTTYSKELEETSQNFDQIKEKELERILENKKRQIDEAKNNNNYKQNKIEELKKKFHESFQLEDEQWRRTTKKIGRSQPIIYLKPGWLEWTVLIFLGLCEIPLNYTVFANFLLPNIETYILACLLVIAVPIIAHYTGICFRQYEETRKYVYHLAVILPFMLGLNIAVAILRSNYIYQVLEVTISIWNTLTFLGLSIILLIVGIIVSFLHHDKSQELVVVHDIYNKAKAKHEKGIQPLDSEEKETDEEFRNLVKKIESEFEIEKERIENTIPHLKKKIKDAVEIYDKTLNTFKALEREPDSNYKICISRYRATSHRARKNKKRPNSWVEIESLKFVFNEKKELNEN